MRRYLLVALGVIAFSALVIRCLAIVEPLGIDQGLWASAVRGMSRGQLLYRDVWEQRPPGIYWIYLAGFRTLGWTGATVAWLDVLAATITTAILFLLGRALAGPLEATAAATLYAALTMPAWLYRYDGFLERSVCETFIVPCVGLAACCAVAVRQRASQTAALGLGLFAGCAIVLKPNAGLYLPALVAWIVMYRKRPLAEMVRPAVTMALGAMLAPAIALLWLWRLDLLEEAKVAVIAFNRFYVAEGFAPAQYAIAFSKAVWLRIKTEPLWTAAAIGGVAAAWDLARERRLPPLAGLALTWGGAAALVIVVNGARLFNSYFINAFAPLALLGAWWLISSARQAGVRRLAGFATLCAMAALLIQRNYLPKVADWATADYRMLRGDSARTEFLDRFGGYGNDRGYSARANAELAEYVRAHTRPDEHVFLFGINGAELYFASDRLTAHRFLRVNFFVETAFPDERFRLDRVTAELAERQPRYIIFETLHSRSDMGRAADALQQQESVRGLLRSYFQEATIEDFTLYRRVD